MIPPKFFKIIPIAAPFICLLLTSIAAYGGVPWLLTHLDPRTQYWILRSIPLIYLIPVPLSTLILCLSLDFHKRKLVALSGLITTILPIAFYAFREYTRLSPYFSKIHSWQLLSFLDPVSVGGSILAIACCAVAARISLIDVAQLPRAKRAIFGDADWMEMEDAKKLFPQDGEIIIGEAYRVDLDLVKDLSFNPHDAETWGQGGRAPLLTYKQNFDSTHMLFFAGSGGFKTTSNVIPTALSYQGPLICLDPSTEIAPIVIEQRRSMGREVFVLDPLHPTDGFNVLEGIQGSSSFEEDIVALAHLLLSESGKGEDSTGRFFQSQAHNLITGFMAHVLLSPEYDGKRNLRSLRQILCQSEPGVLKLLRDIQKESTSPFIQETLGVFTNMTSQTFSGVYANASKDTQWLSLENYALLTCGNKFRGKDITEGNIDIFINIPSKILRSYSGIGRIIIGSLLNAMVQANGSHTKRALFVLDEVDLLGYMQALEEARDRGRKYGISLMMFYQSVGQLEKHYTKEGAKSWIEGCAFASYAAIKSIETAKSVSMQCGEMTIEAEGSSKSVGLLGLSGSARATQSIHVQKRQLILPHEIIQSMRKDEQIIILQGHPPLRCGRAMYFRREEMKSKAKENRFSKEQK